MKGANMYRLICLVLLLLLLFSCSQDNKYAKYENTKWSGPYGPWEMSLYINKVKGNHFEGEMHKPAGRIAYFEGQFLDNDSLTFTELYHVLGSGLIMDGTYPGVIIGDTLQGICNFYNVQLPDNALYRYTLIKNTSYTSRTGDQKTISKAFQKTKHLTKKIFSLVPWNKNPFEMLNDSSKVEYADLVRKKRDIIEREYESIRDQKFVKTKKDELFRDTNKLWNLTKNPEDSVWLVNVIDRVKEGEDGYYRKQQMKLRLGKQSFQAYKEFLNSMYDKKLTLDDEITYLFDLVYTSENESNLESKFNTKYATLISKHPDNENLARLTKVVKSIEISKRLKPGVKAPNFEVTILSGKKTKLSDFTGKFVFLDFWGSWCGPCRGEIPNIKKLDKTIPKDKLQVLGLAKDDLKSLEDYIKKENITYPNALADEELISTYGITGYPTTFLIGPDGKIAAKELRGEKLVELVQEIMKDYK